MVEALWWSGRSRLLPDRRTAAPRAAGFVSAVTALLAAPPAFAAAAVAVSPTVVAISAAKPTELVSLTNRGEEPVRFQVSLEAWDQRPNGEAVMTPTQDIVVFPPLLALAPHETKKLRIGAAIPFGDREVSYRMAVQELPSATPDSGGGQVTILTRLSLPIFLQPAKALTAPRLAAPALADGVLSFTVENSGTAHFVVRQLKITGDDGAAGTTFEIAQAGWYVLAGGRTQYRLALAAAACRKTRHARVAATIGDGEVDAELDIAPAACGGAAETKFIAADAAPAAP